MPDIPIGTIGRSEQAVTEANAISFLGNAGARVLATPWMIAYMEMTARDAVKPLLAPGEDTVGTHVDVRHLAATPIGVAVRFEAEVIRVEGRRVEFRVMAWDNRAKVGEGTHERTLIDIERFAERLKGRRQTA